MKNAIELLDAELERAIDAGIEVEGWFLTKSEDGYSAWLYRLGPDGSEQALVTVAEVFDTPESAAGAVSW